MRRLARGGLVLLLAAGCTSQGAPEPATSTLVANTAPEPAEATWTRFVVDLDPVAAATGTGPAPVVLATGGATVQEDSTGTTRVGSAPRGDGLAAAFGRDRGTGDAGLAVVADADELLQPGTRRFRVGADVLVDPVPALGDTGANVVQRGLYESGGQFKLQVDAGVPSCRVSGGSGAVLVEGEPLAAGRWYRLLCDRDRSRVTLFVAEVDDEVATTWRSWTTTGATGPVHFDAQSGPLAVGAKLNSRGQVVADSPDAFHGLVDDVLVEIAP